MNEENIKKLFHDNKYDELLKQLIISSKKRKHSNDINIYLYFLYGILGKIEERDNQYLILEKLFQGYEDEMFYQFAIKCIELTSTRGTYYKHDDVLRFMDLAIDSNPDHAGANYWLGTNDVLYLNDIIGFQNGIDRINKAVRLDPLLLEKKIAFFLNLLIVNYNGFKLIYSHEKTIILLNEYNSIPDKYKNNDYYLKLTELYIAIGDYTSAIQIESKIQINKSEMAFFKFNSLMYNLFLIKGDFNNAIKYASNINLWNKAECFFKFKKYKEAAECYIEYSNSSSISYKYSVKYNIAESFFYCNQYVNALKYIDEHIQNSETKLYVEESYFNALNLKGKIHLRKKEFHIAIDAFTQAYHAIKYNDNNVKYKIVLEDTIFNLAVAYADYHIFKFVSKKNSIIIPEVIEDIQIYNNLLSNINSSYHFNTNLKIEFDRFSKELISINGEREKDIQNIEKKIENKKNRVIECSEEYNYKISSIAIKTFPDNKEILFRLARCQSIFKNYDESLKSYKRLIYLDSDNPVYFNNIAMIYFKKKQYEKSYMFIKKAFKKSEFNNDNIQIYDNYLSVISQLVKKTENKKTLIKFKIEAKKLSDKLMKKILAVDNYSYRRELESLPEIHNLELFKYKEFNTNIIDSIINGKLYFSKLSQLNDPLDLPLLKWSDFKEFTHFEIKDNDVKIFCSSLEDKNTLMWSHYADSHKGICIGYKIKSLPHNIGWNPINYVHSNFNYERISKDKGAIAAGLYTKNINWSYEKEIRLVQYKEETEFVNYMHPISPNDKDKVIDGFISQIIIGYKFPENKIALLKTLLNELNSKRICSGLPKIKLYRIKLDSEKPLNLLKVTLNY